MPKNWKTYTVEELIRKNIIDKPLDGNHGGIHPVSKDFVEIGVPFITATDVKRGNVDLKGCKFITEKQAKSLRKGFAKTDDVLITHKASLGRTAIVPNLKTAFIVLTPQVTYYRVTDQKFLNNHFLKYYFDSPNFQSVFNSFGNSGSTRAYVGISEQLRLPISIPPIEEQRRIAGILSALDEKIELNLQMNATLEKIAQAVFKHWFVDFQFPDFDGELIDGLPKGWRKGKLEELIDTISITHKFPNDKIIFLNTSDVLDGQVLKDDYSEVKTLPGQAKKSIQKHDILYSEIRPINRRFAYIDFDADDYVVSTKLMVLRAKNLVAPIVLYYFLKSDDVLRELQMLAESRSGTFPQITFYHIKNLEMIIPDSKTLEIYTNILKANFEKISLNLTENKILTQIRDSLLPKLMSGKIRVAE